MSLNHEEDYYIHSCPGLSLDEQSIAMNFGSSSAPSTLPDDSGFETPENYLAYCSQHTR